MSLDVTFRRELPGLTGRQKGKPGNLECVGLGRGGGTQSGAENLRRDIGNSRSGAMGEDGSDQSSKVLRLETERNDRSSYGDDRFSLRRVGEKPRNPVAYRSNRESSCWTSWCK